MEKYYERQKQLQKEVNKLEKKKTTKNQNWRKKYYYRF